MRAPTSSSVRGGRRERTTAAMPISASAATAAAASHRHLFPDAAGGWLRSRFPTVRTLADGRRARQTAKPERGCFKRLDSDT
jgi:hypothetical protein